MNDPDKRSEYFEHAAEATELLKRSVAVHEEEEAGTISHDEAIDRVIELNERAATEIDLALEAFYERRKGGRKS